MNHGTAPGLSSISTPLPGRHDGPAAGRGKTGDRDRPALLRLTPSNLTGDRDRPALLEAYSESDPPPRSGVTDRGQNRGLSERHSLPVNSDAGSAAKLEICQ